MKSMCPFLNDLWRRSAGLQEQKDDKFSPTLESLQNTEWSADFERYMRNRLVIGAMRYGSLGDKNKPIYHRVESMKKRLDLYNSTGNLEFLVDVANLCLCEFVESKHPRKHFRSIDDGEHVDT